MRRFVCLVVLVPLFTGCATEADRRPDVLEAALEQEPDVVFEQAVVGPQGDGTWIVATSQRIDPAGESITFPGRPVDLALSPDAGMLAVKNMGDLVFFDTTRHTILQTLELPDSGASFAGIAFGADGQRVWVTDTDGVLRAAVRAPGGEFAWQDAIDMPARDRSGPYPGGLALDQGSGVAWVALSRNNSVAVVDLAGGRVDAEIDVGMAPYTVVLAGDKAYVSNWGGRRPAAGDTTGPSSGSEVVVDPDSGIASSGTVSVIDVASREVVGEIDVGLHPSGMALSPDGSRLFVANANSDTVSVIDTSTDRVVDTLDPKPMPELPLGSAPNALAVSPDGTTLYVANGGNNAIAVIDLADGSLRGLIPTGWYPGALLLSPDGSTLHVANTKGVGGRDVVREEGYNSHDHLGSVSFIAVPDADTLEDYTIRAATNMQLPRIQQRMNLPAVAERTVPVPTRPGETSVFKHVLYIIKENRTYDQVLGDLPQGNGDPDLTIFGRDVTPNIHAMAERWVLLDNTYCNGVLSADGHQWTDEGMVTDYIEKAFGGFVRSYPYDGGDALAYASSGFIWDHALAAGLTFRTYGEFVGADIEPADATWSDIYADYLDGTSNVSIRAFPKLHTLEPYMAPTFIGFPGKVQDVYRAREFIRELEGFEAAGEMPNLMIMLLPNDHTVGTREGYPTPRAAVADNDLALGQIVEAISNSSFWDETVIFVVQDDPQGGFDHVDGRRTVALTMSPYTRRGEVVSTHYNQNSILRTIELILGLPPMSQFDMAATPMVDAFTDEPDFTPYAALPNIIPLDEMNPAVASLTGLQRHYAEQSMAMPLDDIDEADEDLFNRVIWHSVKGWDVPYPAAAVDDDAEERGRHPEG